jgi:hypothetical protein
MSGSRRKVFQRQWSLEPRAQSLDVLESPLDGADVRGESHG